MILWGGGDGVKIVVRLDIRTEPIIDFCMNVYAVNPNEYYVSHWLL